MSFRCLLWDFDGTLFDTYPALITAIERTLHDLDRQESAEAIAQLLSDTLNTCISTLVKKHHLDRDDFESRLNVYRQQIAPDQRPPFPGAIELCQRIIASGGQNYIFTHRDRATLLGLLDHHQVTHLFAGIMTQDDGYPRKPDSAGFNALLEKYGLARNDVLTIGDRDLDIQAGLNAHIATCLFNTQPSPHVPPDFVITRFEELDPILKLTR